jgi:RHS repeat-associated protein
MSSISTTQFTSFDNFGRNLVSEQITDGNTYQSKYKYDFGGRLIEQTYPSGKVVRNFFENDGDLAKVVKNGKTYVSDFDYNALGRIKSLKLGNGLYETAEFNTRNQLTKLGLGSTPTNNNLWKLELKYGEILSNGQLDINKNSGNIAQQVISMPNVSFTQTYKYDAIDRLVEAKETDSNGTENWQQTFNYDRFGNRIGRSQTIGNTTLAINSQTLPNIDSNTNRFALGQGYLYDKTGNIKQDLDSNNKNQVRQFIFNGDNKQVHVKDANNVTIGTYYYDGNGQRVKKSTALETTIFVHDGEGKLIEEYSTKLSQNPTVSYLTKDQIGTPRIITNKKGEVASRRDYMPFGEDLFIGARATNASLKYGNADNVRQKFTGYQKDDETQLDFAEARMFNANHGRFTAVDPLLTSGKSSNPQTFNRFVYTSNNPVTRVDINGKDWFYYEDYIVYRNNSSEKVNVIFWRDVGPLHIVGGANRLPSSVLYVEARRKGEHTGWAAFNSWEKEWSPASSQDNAISIAEKYRQQAVLNYIVGILDANSIAFELSGAAAKLGVNRNSNTYKVGHTSGTIVASVAALLGIGVLNQVVNKFGKVGQGILNGIKQCCFVAGTPIHTIDGLKPIEEIKVGDMVLSYDENTKTYEYKPVAQTFTAVKDNIVKLKIAGESKIFTTTTEHPFYVKIKKQYQARSSFSTDSDGEWKTAEELKVGDKVLRPDGNWTRILRIERDNTPTFVYNFEVEGNHNYFVGEVGVLSHNCNRIPVGGIINIGGEVGDVGMSNVNILYSASHEGMENLIPNLIKGNGSLIGNMFRQGSADLIKAENLIPTNWSWNMFADGAFKVLKSGGRVEMHLFNSSDSISKITNSFINAGFKSKNINVTRSGSSTFIYAIR